MANERPEMLANSATLYFGPWYRQSPFFNADATRRLHRLRHLQPHVLPGYFDDPDTEYAPPQRRVS